MTAPQQGATVHVLVKGRVQGVGFRFFAQDAARSYGLKGWVKNLAGGEVEAEVEGPRLAAERWLDDMRRGPMTARVEDVQVDWKPFTGQYSDFSIR